MKRHESGESVNRESRIIYILLDNAQLSWPFAFAKLARLLDKRSAGRAI